MAENEVGKQVRSFVSFALAMRPSVTLDSAHAGDTPSDMSVKFTLDDSNKLSLSKLASLESLLEKYEPLKEFLRSTSREHTQSDLLASPTVTFQPGVNYQIINLTSEQVAVATKVAQLIERTHYLHTAADHAGAALAYDDLQRYVEQKRDKLIGEFKNIGRITDGIGMHGVGRSGDPGADVQDAGEVIFVLAAIFIM